jgi:hypothetical protein
VSCTVGFHHSLPIEHRHLRMLLSRMSSGLLFVSWYRTFGLLVSSQTASTITYNVNCYENRALIPPTFRPMPNLVETTELAFRLRRTRPILIADVAVAQLLKLENCSRIPFFMFLVCAQDIHQRCRFPSIILSFLAKMALRISHSCCR